MAATDDQPDDALFDGEIAEDPHDLELKFLSTPEAQEWLDWGDEAEEAIKKAANQPTVSVPTAFLARILPEIKASPYLFFHLREARARLVAELGLPPEENK